MQHLSPIKVSSGIAEDLMIENDMMENYLFVKTQDTKNRKPRNAIQPRTSARITRDNAIITFQNQQLQLPERPYSPAPKPYSTM